MQNSRVARALRSGDVHVPGVTVGGSVGMKLSALLTDVRVVLAMLRHDVPGSALAKAAYGEQAPATQAMKVRSKEASVHLGSCQGDGEGYRPVEASGQRSALGGSASLRAARRVKSEQAQG
jgi:hypothetical protein